jgi:CrcB protein
LPARRAEEELAVVNIVVPVFIGGALGAMLREFIMLMVPNLVDNFPLDILVANLVAAFLLGLVTALHRRQIVSEGAEMLFGTGIAGGLSTFSSFAYGAVVLMSASTASAVVASVYVVISLVLGYIAVAVGLKLGGQGSA